MATVQQHVAPRYDWDDFVALPDDDRRELIDGELVETEVPTDVHEHIVAMLVAKLWNWAEEHGGLVLASGYKVRVRADRGAMPDVQFSARATRAGPPTRGSSAARRASRSR